MAKNIYGYGATSLDASIDTFSVPYAMSAITTTPNGEDIEITWAAPLNGGVTISAYDIRIYKPSTGEFLNDANCDGTNSEIRDARSCILDMNYLVATYGLSYGQFL